MEVSRVCGVVLACLVGCGGSLPNRYVVEHDLGDFRYRRYQKVLDVEFPVQGNDAVGHTASYVHRDRGQDVAFTTAFVTVYETPRSLVAEVADRLGSLGTYDVRVGELQGDRVWWLDGGTDRWALWVSGRHVVKLGAPGGGDLPEDVADVYLDLYPSDLGEDGRARDGARSTGPSRRQAAQEEEQLAMPRHLRESVPR